MIETTDHDQGPPALYSGPGGALIAVLLDGRRGAMVPTGTTRANTLINRKPGGGGNRSPGSCHSLALNKGANDDMKILFSRVFCNHHPMSRDHGGPHD